MTASERARRLAVAAAEAAAEKKAENIIALDVSDHMVLTDAFVVVSGLNERHVAAIVDEVEDRLFREGAKAVRKEGVTQSRWVLLDFGDIVVHVQHEEDREFYSLERLWRDCPIIELPAESETHSLGER